MALPAFTIDLGQQILRGLVTVGKFDGKTPSLACGTSGGKVLIHSPHEGSMGLSNGLPMVRFLNLNKKITALTSGSLSSDKTVSNPETLFIGTQSNLLAYDVERNSDVYFRDVQDGVNTLIVGKLANISFPVVVAGGNCSVLGYNNDGLEVFWTVTADNVASMTLCDVDNDGANELIIGSDDFEIRCYKNEKLVGEITEADKVTHLHSLEANKFSYGLSNGTVGVYENANRRVWRVKTKNKVTSLVSYDLDGDGVLEVISGWSNGNISARSDLDGEIVFKDTLGSPIAALVVADYRLDGKEEVIACTENGQIRGYLPTVDDVGVGSAPGANLEESTGDIRNLAELQAKKQDLTNELKILEKSLKTAKTGEVSPGSLPGGTKLSYSLEPDRLNNCVSLQVTVSTDVLMYTAIAIDLEGVVLSGLEVLTVSPVNPTRQIIIPLHPTRNTSCNVKAQVHVGVRGYVSQLHVMELSVSVPRFARFLKHPDTSTVALPQSYVSFYLNESTSRLNDWMKDGFIMTTPAKLTKDKFKVILESVCDSQSAKKGNDSSEDGRGESGPTYVIITGTMEEGEPGSKGRLNVQIRCDNIDLVGDLVQDLAKYLQIYELESIASFPIEAKQFEELMGRVDDFNSARLRLTADMAEDSQRVKALVVRAEDSRLMSDMDCMRRAYTELFALNNQLIGGYNVRAGNHEGLLVALKEVNQVIQKAANLRVGEAKTRVIRECRSAVKANNMNTIIRIISQGQSDKQKK